MLQLEEVLSFLADRRQISAAALVLLMTVTSGLRIERQQELLLKLEAVSRFLSSCRQLSAIVALLITASSLCPDRQQELMLQLEAI
jgi:hypothetical protein